MDETYLKVSGIWNYLYRAVDQFGQVIDVMLSERRDAAAARRFFQGASVCAARPVGVTTDRAPVYPPVLDELSGWRPAEAACLDSQRPPAAVHGRVGVVLVEAAKIIEHDRDLVMLDAVMVFHRREGLVENRPRVLVTVFAGEQRAGHASVGDNQPADQAPISPLIGLQTALWVDVPLRGASLLQAGVVGHGSPLSIDFRCSAAHTDLR